MTGKIKIYINGRFLTQPITGVQRYAHELVMAWDRMIGQKKIDTKKYKFILLSPSRKLIHQLNLKNIGFRKTGLLTGHLWEQFELPLYSRDGMLFCPGNTAPLLSLLTSQKSVVTVHDLSFLYFPKAYSQLFRLWYGALLPIIFQLANRIITVSETERQSILKYFKKVQKKIISIQNGGLPQNHLKNAFSSKQDTPNQSILYVGALSRRKNFQGVVKAAAILNQNMLVTLTVVGAGGKTFKGTDYKIPTEIHKKIRFKGQVNSVEELIFHYNSHDCLVFPSFYESSGLPPLEAMACGCPVIASDIPVLNERCGNAALYCDPSNPLDIAEKIERVLKNSDLREELIKNGLKRTKQYNWNTCALESFQVIQELISCQ